MQPRNVWTDKILDDFDYTFTELDAMPDGWRKAFGLRLCEEIRKELIEIKYLYKYRIVQIKEKFGELRWYDNRFSRKGYKIIEKYTHLSRNICISCGKPDVAITDTGWISPYCKECFYKISWVKKSNKNYEDFICEDNPEKMMDEYTITRYDENGVEKITYNIKETADEIRNWWEKKHKNGE